MYASFSSLPYVSLDAPNFFFSLIIPKDSFLSVPSEVSSLSPKASIRGLNLDVKSPPFSFKEGRSVNNFFVGNGDNDGGGGDEEKVQRINDTSTKRQATTKPICLANNDLDAYLIC